ncbi:WD40 repeat-like protein [Acephala macrosclerotiorum]|nr:WD40 repeat-like protein [Acephala macrosclerotiorum]
MSDFDSPADTPQPPSRRRTKKRSRYDDSEASTPRDSSPDELADPRDHQQYRSSRQSVGRRDSAPRRRAHSSDGSVDELDDTYHEQHGRRREHSNRSSPETPDSSHSSIRAPSPPAYRPLKLNYRCKFILRGHKKGVAQVRFSPDGRWIASCSADGTIKVWDAATGKHMRTLEGHLAGVSTIAWSSDSNTIASGSDDKTIRLWHRATGKAYPAPLSGHHNYVYSLAFSPKGNMLVSGSYDEAVFLWDLRQRRLMRSLPAHSDPVGGVDFIRDGTLVCSCSTDGLTRVWDTATGQCLRTLVHEDNAPVTTVRFSPNGRYILAFTLDSCVRLWDYVSGSVKKTYQGHVNKKYSLGGAFGVSGSDGFIVSGSEDGDILFWDVKTKEIAQRVSDAHEGVVCWVDTTSGSNATVVSGGLDSTVKIWVNMSDDEVDDINGVKFEREDGIDADMVDVKIEERDGYDDTPRDDRSINGAIRDSPRSPERMDED